MTSADTVMIKQDSPAPSGHVSNRNSVGTARIFNDAYSLRVMRNRQAKTAGSRQLCTPGMRNSCERAGAAFASSGNQCPQLQGLDHAASCPGCRRQSTSGSGMGQTEAGYRSSGTLTLAQLVTASYSGCAGDKQRAPTCNFERRAWEPRVRTSKQRCHNSCDRAPPDVAQRLRGRYLGPLIGISAIVIAVGLFGGVSGLL
jgi:hypothetical protein